MTLPFPSRVEPGGAEWTASISEGAAQRKLDHLSIAPAAFREFALAHRHARRNADGEVAYSASFIDDLNKNWVPREKAARTYSNGGFYYYMTSHNIKPLRIGRASFYRREDLDR